MARAKPGRRKDSVFKAVKPSEACGGDVSRTATETALARETAENNALKAARDAADRACKSKKCEGSGEQCTYVEKSSEGSSAPIPNSNPLSYTATMTTKGSCACEK